MKYFKYLTLCLLAVLFVSCSDKDVTYQMTPVENKAYVQIYYVAPMKAITANYMYYADLNGVEYGNSGSTFLAINNFIPSGGVGLYYTVDAGDLNLVFKDQKKNVKYNGVAKGLQAGKHYLIFIHNLEAEPAVIEDLDIPMFPGTAESATHCSVRFCNFLYEGYDANGNLVPFTDKLQYALQNTETKEYEPIGKPVAFGEATEYFTPTIIKTVFNSSGYQRRDLTLFRIDANTGENLGQLMYTNAKGTEVKFTDYWTWYIGRAYVQSLYGLRGDKSVPASLKQFGAL